MSKLLENWKNNSSVNKINIILAPLTILLLFAYSFYAFVLIVSDPSPGGFVSFGGRDDGIRALWIVVVFVIYLFSLLKFSKINGTKGFLARATALIIGVIVHLAIFAVLIEGSRS